MAAVAWRMLILRTHHRGRYDGFASKEEAIMERRDRHDEEGRVGYLVLYLLGAPVGLLLLLWVLLGDNLIGAG